MDRFFIIKPKDVFTVKEAAEYLTVSTKTVYNLIKCSDIEAFKIKSRYKITAEAMGNYIEDNKLKSEK